ncbi:hypothetical protein [Halalkalibacter nanhaiisediminis]|uniref:Uncharacterized protein n=1 Tax=Halalkalibacter nanhaiisediminis TaxID=688079 RepID=A0A562QEL7_9BACI|nr:hypothetical protein [Halalkalibacter nanhaiisediminis]TWI54620.1 hypothetical protein IQ10_02842 [Halalkalibacter nanhaiisediminis]
MNVRTELFKWLNEQTDLSSSQVDLVDGFVFMLRKMKQHGSIRLIDDRQIHPRFWRTHDRTFGYQLMGKKSKQKRAHLYQFYIDIAFTEQLVQQSGNKVMLTDAGNDYLSQKRDYQLDLLFSHIW